MHLAQNSQTPLLQTARITPFPYPRLVGMIPVLHVQSGPEDFSRREPSPPCGPVSPASRSPSHLATGLSAQSPYLLLSPTGALTLTMGAVKTETIKRTLTNTIRMSGVGKGMGSIVRAALGSTGRQEGGGLPAT